jgi:hypothetical protein
MTTCPPEQDFLEGRTSALSGGNPLSLLYHRLMKASRFFGGLTIASFLARPVKI